MLVDAHCHLSGLKNDALQAVLRRAYDAGVTRLVAIGAGYGIEDNANTLGIANAHANIDCALAVHPHDAQLLTDVNFAELSQLIAGHAKVKAVGEIGLDYHYLHSAKEVQKDVFRRFIRLALQLKKPVVIHDRECDTDCVDILKEEGASACGGMAHCFSGDATLAGRYLDLGFYVSFSGIITFKTAEAVRAAARCVPEDRLLVETDSPFLAPVPFRGKKNEPAFVRHVAEGLAATRGVSFERIAEITTANAVRLFGLG